MMEEGDGSKRTGPAPEPEESKNLNIKKEHEELWIMKERLQGLETDVSQIRKEEGGSEEDRKSDPDCGLQKHPEGSRPGTTEPQAGLKDWNHFSSFQCQNRFGLETPVGPNSGHGSRSLNCAQGFGPAEHLNQPVKIHVAQEPHRWRVRDRNLTPKSDIISYCDPEDRREPEPDSNSHTGGNVLPENDNPDRKVTIEDWKEAEDPRPGDPRSGLRFVANDGTPSNDLGWSSAENPFSCSYCTKTFNRKDNLKRHARIHTGEKPMGCTGSQQDSDPSAPKRSRSEEKRYSCSVCKKRFGWSTDLVRHMRTHTGERPYSCSFCSKGFTQKATLTAHVTLHTGEKLFRCHRCGKGFNQKSYLRKHKCLEVGSL